MEPKVADFGLSRRFEDNKTQTVATFLSGSLGYMAPEYLVGRIVTTKADVYNLGVIILEIITGTKEGVYCSYRSPTSWQNFVECVLENWRNRLEAAPSETDCKHIKFCLEIGLDCIKLHREERPTSREIIERLDRWESTHYYVNNEEIPPANQSNITGMTAAADDSNTETPRPYGSLNRSRESGLFRRFLSWVMTRRRSDFSSYPVEKFTFALLEAATKGFAMDTKIFGTVYHGELQDGREVAIKRCKSGPRSLRFHQESLFRSELAFHSRYHHKHVLGLVGYCEEKKKRLLVYEYMKNGSLYDHLFADATRASSPSPVVSSWKLRIKILLGASRGIEYLHSYAVPPIIHRDVKSSHILLDADWTARVSGFGLSLAQSEVQAQAHLKTAGTVGYMDPEYYGLGLGYLSVKSDVYGFGVVMLEVLTGKRAIFKEAAGGSPVSVVDYAVPSIVAGELSKVLDQCAPEPAAHEAEAVELVAYTAVHCVRLEGKDRPAMDDIVVNLETALALCEGDYIVRSPSSDDSLSVTSMDQEVALV